MTGHPTLLAALLENKGLHRYGSFCLAYEKVAQAADGKPGSPPSRAQFHRWLTGNLRSVPYADGPIPAPARIARRARDLAVSTVHG